ncbi:MAG: hypothetical protein ACXAC7_09795 [Candidatus Hodarchaeales archaeon]
METNDSRISIILDCNLWIRLITESTNKFRKKLLSGNYEIIITSYMVVEILRVLKRLSSRLKTSYNDLESLFWDFCNHSKVKMDFQQPFSDSLISEIKNVPEIKMLAKLIDLEQKDVPYIVCAFQNKAIFFTDDKRSLLDKRDYIKNQLGIEIKSIREFMKG